MFPKALPLRYTFSVESIPEDAYLADVRQGTTSILDTGLRLGDTAPEPLEVVINPTGAHLDGIVRDRDNSGIAFTRVVLVPEGPRRGVSSFYKTAVTDDVGKFTIRGIAPGEYKLFAWESSPARAWRGPPEFMAPFEEFGNTCAHRACGPYREHGGPFDSKTQVAATPSGLRKPGRNPPRGSKLKPDGLKTLVGSTFGSIRYPQEAILHLFPVLIAPDDKLLRIRVELVVRRVVVVREAH